MEAPTALQHHGARLEGVHDALHDGLEQAVEGGVVRPISQRHIHAVVLAVLLRMGQNVQSDNCMCSAAETVVRSQQCTALALPCLCSATRHSPIRASALHHHASAQVEAPPIRGSASRMGFTSPQKK